MSTTQYQVLVRNGSDDHFIASVLGLSDCAAEGKTKEEAIAHARTALIEKLAAGEIVTIEVEDNDVALARATRNVWREEAERFREDTTFDEFVTEMQSNRRDLNSEKSPS